jgi:hypothetical protein
MKLDLVRGHFKRSQSLGVVTKASEKTEGANGIKKLD